MKRKLTMIMVGLFLCLGTALGQTAVKGTVVSQDDGQPVIGATVRVVGADNVGVVTDVDGNFSLTVPAGKNKLKISSIGMITQEVTAKSNLHISLKSDQHDLDEVMVVAYGTQKKSSFTGAASTLKADKIEKLQVSNLSKALEGTVAGVQISSASNSPGASSSIIVRGIGSISSSREPLIVVDGVPYEGSLNSISSQDIESLTILKDAAANSMYGARGSNGVIMVTTKGSKSGKAKVNFEGRVGFNTRGVPTYDVIKNAGEYYEMMFESYRNSLIPSMGWAGASQYAAQNLISKQLKYNKFKGVADNELIDPLTGKLNPNAKTYKWNDDWTEDPFTNGTRQEYNVNVQGGSDDTQIYASLGYLNDEGYVVNSKFERISGRLKVDQKIGENVKLGANLAYANTARNTFSSSEGSNTTYANIFFFAQQIGPIYPIYMYDAEGNRINNKYGNQYDFGEEYARPFGASSNPVAQATDSQNEAINDNFTSRGYLEWNFLKDFKFTANIAYDLFNTNQTNFYTPIGGDAASVNGRAYQYATRRGTLNLNQLLDWNHTFGKHGVHVLLGHETNSVKYRQMYGHKTNFADPTIPDFNNATSTQDLAGYRAEYSLEGYFAKGEYDYADRYYFTASLRRDGSSKFGPDNRWGSFWALGGSWRLSEEPWMKDIKEINNLKLKASYGTQGNDNILDSGGGQIWQAYKDRYQVNTVGGEAAFTKVFRGNPDLTWEKSANFNVGFESRFFDRFNVNFDFFIKETKDMIYASPLSPSEGSPSFIYRNEMNMKNTGFELEINADIIKTDNIYWTAGLNLTHYKNELTKLPDSKPASLYPNGYQASPYWRKIGGSLYDWYLYEYVGVDKETGLPQYNKYTTDENGKEVVSIVNTSSEASYRETGKSAIPDLTGGFSTSLTAYGFDLSVQTAFQLGGYVLDSFYANLMNAGTAGQNFHKDMFNRWTPDNRNTNIPKLNLGSQEASVAAYSDFYLTKASYFSLRNITLGYTFPKKWLNAAGISNLRVYLTGDNVWYMSKRKGLDTRQYFSGQTGYTYSAMSTYSVGVNLSF